MTGRQFATIFASIFFMGALPLILSQFSGSASAGIASGLMLPLSHLNQVLLFLAIGLLSAYTGTRVMFLLPLAFLLMLAMGIMLDLDYRYTIPAKMVVLLVALCFGIIAHSMELKNYIAFIAITAPAAFYIGGEYAAIIPNTASPPHFMVGALFSTGLIHASGLCIGLAVGELLLPLFQDIMAHPAVVSAKENWNASQARIRVFAASMRFW